MRHSPLDLNAAWLLSVNVCSLLEWSVKYTLTSNWDACGQQLEKVSPSYCTTICNCSPQGASSVINFQFPFFALQMSKRWNRFHSVPSTTQRFSFEAFQFVNGQVEPYLYVHCEVVLCNLTDAKHSCRKHCSGPLVNSRQKRGANTGVYDLEKGPIVLSRDSECSFEGELENEIEARQNQSNLETN